jgi:hypothetical protein
MWCRVDRVWTGVPKGCIASIFRVQKSGNEDGTETSVHTISARRHIPDDGILHSHRRENLKSCIQIFGLNNIFKGI